MEKGRRDENMREEESRERVKIARNVGKKEEKNRQRAMEERKCFGCGEFEHIAHHCRNLEEEESVQVPSNKFEVLKSRVMQREERSGGEVRKDRREILKEEKAKKGVEVKQMKVERQKKKEKLLREVTVKIGLKQEKKEEEIVVDALLDSGATELVMSEEFARKHRFRRMKLERLIYVRNINSTLNYAGPIVNTVEMEIYFKEHKKRTLIDVIGEQKWEVILGMPWLACHNPEIDWRTGEV